MKKMIVAIGLIFMFDSYIFADSQSQCQYQKQEQSQNQSQSQETRAIIEERLQAIQPLLPEHAPHGPWWSDEHFCWKKFVQDPNELEAEQWTLLRAKRILKQVKNDWFVKEFIVKCVPSDYPRTKTVRFRCNLAWDNEFLNDYIKCEPIRVATESSKVDSTEIIAKTVQVAMEEIGADIIVLRWDNFGLSTYVKAKAVGFPFSFTTVKGEYIYGGGMGFSSAEIGRDKKPAIIVIPYVSKERIRALKSGKAKTGCQNKKQGNIAYLYIVNIRNSNGSIGQIKLEKIGNNYIGPRGEIYAKLPTQEQLSIYDLSSDKNREEIHKFTYASSE